MANKYTTEIARRRGVEGSLCYYCRRPMYANDPQGMPTNDHRLPISRGGAKTGPNVVWCCYQCNQTKADMTEDEFREWIRRGRPKKTAYLREIGL